MDRSIIHPVIFFNEDALRTESIGAPEVDCIIRQVTKSNNYSGKLILIDFVINNITQLSTTFIIKLLEDNIDKNEIAYIVDFNSEFDMKSYLVNNIQYIDSDTDNDAIINIIRSNIIFILNQFIQFYCMYKLVYEEGVDLYKFLFSETYDTEVPTNTKQQNKYVFCYSIMSNMLETLLPDIDKCCVELKSTISNIKILLKGDN